METFLQIFKPGWAKAGPKGGYVDAAILACRFGEGSGHYVGDLQISLVEKVPAGKYRYSFLFMTSIRKRLEARWIKRLRASLNHNTQVWHLLSGYDASRGPPTRHDSI